MKLYIYEHCPFSARVRFVAAMLDTPLDIIVLDYDDEQTTTQIMGSKQVPVLVKDNGEAVSESLDIVDYFLHLSHSEQSNVVSQAVLDWQREAFLPLQQIGYPRWAHMGLKEFERDRAKQAWALKKESDTLNFETLLKDTPEIARTAENLIRKAGTLLALDSGKDIALVDAAIIFSILRGYFSSAEVQWQSNVEQWMLSMSQHTHISLLK